MLVKSQNPHGGDIYSNKVRLDFSANINPFGMPESVRSAIVSSVERCSAYPDPYCTDLRRKIADAEGVPVGCVICGAGAADLIYQFAYSLDGGRPALIVSPTFCEYEQALKAAGIAFERYYLKEKDGFRLTPDLLDTDLSRYSAVFICSPNNPTGVTADRELIESAADSGVRMFLDLCFLDLTEEPDKYRLASLTERYPGIFALKAFTKSYAMAGLRLGYAVCRDEELLERMSEKTQCWNVSTPAQAAGAAALSCGGWLRESVKKISEERRYLESELDKLGVTVFPGEANYLLLRTSGGVWEKLMGMGIMVRDCSNYDGLGGGFIRVAVRTRSENECLVKAFREALR